MRSSITRLLFVSLVAIGLIGILAACGSDEGKSSSSSPSSASTSSSSSSSDEAAPTPTATAQVSDIAVGIKATATPTPAGDKPVYGGYMNFIGCCSGSLDRGIDPYMLGTSGGNPINYSNLIMPVFPYDPAAGIEYEGGLATSWEQRANGDWVFKLREGVTWHDGEKFTADDVVATVNRFTDEEVDVGSTANQMRATFTGATKVDDYTVIIHTGGSPDATAFSYFPAYHLMIVPAHHIIGPDPSNTEDWTQRWVFLTRENQGVGIGTGPFKQVFFDPETEMVFVRDENFFLFDEFGQRLPYLDGYIRTNVPDGTRRMARFAAGTADYTIGKGAGLHPDRARELCANTRDETCYIQEFPHGYFNTILNFSSTEMWKDKNLIAASRYAQDMDEIADLAYGGRQGYMVMDRGRFPDTALTLEEQAELIPWSTPDRRAEWVQKAKDMIIAAGYPDGFDLPLPYFSGGLCGGSFLDQYSRQVDALVEVGINTVLECREGVIIDDELKEGRWSVNAPGGSTRVIDPADGLLKFHLKDSQMIRGPWRYPSQDYVDDTFRVAAKEIDEAIRNELFRDIERYITNPDWTVYPNMHTVVHVAVHGCVRNFHPGGMWYSAYFAHIRSWMEPGSKCLDSHSPYLAEQGID